MNELVGHDTPGAELKDAIRNSATLHCLLHYPGTTHLLNSKKMLSIFECDLKFDKYTWQKSG